MRGLIFLLFILLSSTALLADTTSVSTEIGKKMSLPKGTKERIQSFCGDEPTQAKYSGDEELSMVCLDLYRNCKIAANVDFSNWQDAVNHTNIKGWRQHPECKAQNYTKIVTEATTPEEAPLSPACSQVKSDFTNLLNTYDLSSCTLILNMNTTAEIYWRGQSASAAAEQSNLCVKTRDELTDLQGKSITLKCPALRVPCLEGGLISNTECMNNYINKTNPRTYMTEVLCHRMSVNRSESDCLKLISACGFHHNRKNIMGVPLPQNDSGEKAVCAKAMETANTASDCKNKVSDWWPSQDADHEVVITNAQSGSCNINYDGKLIAPELDNGSSSSSRAQ